MSFIDGRPTITLDVTAFYPTSGGQPHDLGDINGSPVVDVVDSHVEIFHVLDGPAPEVGQTASGRVDRERRFDHTQQHSGQHVLTQAFERTASVKTVSFHLGAESSTIDVDQPNLNPTDINATEDLANRVVFENRPVNIHFATGEDVKKFALRKPSERDGEIRIVDFEGFDRSACGGTHVTRTGEIGPIKIRRWERRGSTTRVEFLCGWRALRDYSVRLVATREIAERLSVSDHEVRDAVLRTLDELTHAKDELGRLRDALLDAEADGLIASAVKLDRNASMRVIRQSFADRTPDDLKGLAIRIVSRETSVVLLGSTGNRNHLVIAQSPSLSYDAAAILRQVAPTIGARGGGTRNLAQGGGPGGQQVDIALEEAIRLL